ncbi:MAG: thioredoxin [Actinobacteria bacterium]|nr:thioredoxin [Actinomycetota bacterium]MCL6104277.1 thioredoxin [Actinomycetota bacterium]
MPELIETLDDASFDEYITSNPKPVLVDFWASWCGPCKTIVPILEEIAAEYSDRVSIGKLNIDESLSTPQRFSIMSIPTLLLFQKGDLMLRIVGAKSKRQLLAYLQPYL